MKIHDAERTTAAATVCAGGILRMGNGVTPFMRP
jgi:hypothetical protein